MIFPGAIAPGIFMGNFLCVKIELNSSEDFHL
jgi:hypothetical protein